MSSQDIAREKLFTRDYVLMCSNNFFLCMSAYIMNPVLPLYLVDSLHLDSGLVGIVLAIFAIGAMAARPFSGWLADSLPLKLVYLVSGLLYTVFLPFYMAAPMIILTIMRFFQGICFGVANTAQNTIAVGLIPGSRLGTGLGIFSALMSLGMVFGPMLGIISMEHGGFAAVFWLTCIMSVVGTLLCVPVKVRPRAKKAPSRINLSAMIFKPGITTGLCFSCLILGYGMYGNFVAILARDMGPQFDAGIFYALMGVGLIVSRVFAGTLIDKGLMIPLLLCAKVLVAIGTLLLIFVPSLWTFYIGGFALGMAYGSITPSYQAIIVKMADPSQWGAANSTYLLSFDIGMMFSLLGGGFVAQFVGYDGMFLSVLIPLALATLWFIFRIVPAIRAREAAGV